MLLARGLADPRTAGCLISVTEVDVSPDLRHATAYVSVLPDQHENRVIHALRDATMHLQKSLNKKVAFRVVPKLLFKLDRSLKREGDVLAAINEGMARSGREPGERSQREASSAEGKTLAAPPRTFPPDPQRESPAEGRNHLGQEDPPPATPTASRSCLAPEDPRRRDGRPPRGAPPVGDPVVAARAVDAHLQTPPPQRADAAVARRCSGSWSTCTSCGSATPSSWSSIVGEGVPRRSRIGSCAPARRCSRSTTARMT